MGWAGDLEGEDGRPQVIQRQGVHDIDPLYQLFVPDHPGEQGGWGWDHGGWGWDHGGG
jgi:hypothetical protein